MYCFHLFNSTLLHRTGAQAGGVICLCFCPSLQSATTHSPTYPQKNPWSQFSAARSPMCTHRAAAAWHGGVGPSPSCLHSGPCCADAVSPERCPRWLSSPHSLPAPFFAVHCDKINRPHHHSPLMPFLLQMVPSDPTLSPCQAFKALTLCNQLNLVTTTIIKLPAIFCIFSYKSIVHRRSHLIKMILIERGLHWISERSSDLLQAAQLASGRTRVRAQCFWIPNQFSGRCFSFSWRTLCSS